MRYRIEKDSIGEKQVPAEAYYGIQTLRGKENFEITKRGISRQMIKALSTIKKSAAIANNSCGYLDDDISKAIQLSCDEIINGRLHGQFITDLIQGGAGNSINMNANEVIANRANEMMGGKKGVYNFVHPLDHVNLNQSTNDVIPTAGKIAIIRQTKKLIVELKKLGNVIVSKGKEFELNNLGPTFEAFAVCLSRDIKRIESSIESMYDINMGAFSSDIDAKYSKKVVSCIAKFTGEPFKSPRNIFESTRNLDCFLQLSHALKLLSVNLSKMSYDLRLMAGDNLYSVAEISLPKIQPGYSDISEKANTAVLEMVSQVAYFVIGMDTTISFALESAQLDVNVNLPIILCSLFDSLNYIRRASRTLKDKVFEGIKMVINNE
ncbi:MAG: aspartate ammonia-lyase [Bacilli bacterium]|nr:aspartate ammonia-lyase [Bacilli bacterium]